MRAVSSLLLAGAVGLGALVSVPATAEAYGGWRGRDYYNHYVPPPPPAYYGGYGYGYRPRPFVPRPYGYYRPAPRAYYAPPRAYFAPRHGYYAPRAYGFRPGPGGGRFVR